LAKLVLLSFLAFSLVLFGCAGFPFGEEQAEQQQEQEEQEEQMPEQVEEEQEMPEQEEQPPPVPQVPEEEQAEEQEQAEPKELINIYGLLKVGQGIDFQEGKVFLDDIWNYDELQPAIISLKDPNEGLVRQVQLFEFNEAKYESASGRDFWIYVGQTAAGYDIDVKWAKIYAMESKDSSYKFEKELYQDFIGNHSVGSLPREQVFGSRIAKGLLEKGQMLAAGQEIYIGFDDLSKYPEAENPALLSIYGPTMLHLDSAKVPERHSYSYSLNGEYYAIYVSATGTGELTEKRWAAVDVFHAGSGYLEPGRLYFAENNTWEKPAGMKVADITIIGNASKKDSTREFYLKLVDYGELKGDGEFAVIDVLDEDDYHTDRGIVQKDVPMLVTNKYDKTYSVWLEEITTGTPTVKLELYRYN